MGPKVRSPWSHTGSQSQEWLSVQRECLCVDRAYPSLRNSGRIFLGSHSSQLTRRMLRVAGPFTPHGCLFFPGLLGQPVLSVHADLRYLLFKFKTFFLSLTEPSLSHLCLSPGLLIDRLPLCKEFKLCRFAACLDVRTRDNVGLYIAMMFNSSAQKSTFA